MMKGPASDARRAFFVAEDAARPESKKPGITPGFLA
jgi:hypothetical protein